MTKPHKTAQDKIVAASAAGMQSRPKPSQP